MGDVQATSGAVAMTSVSASGTAAAAGSAPMATELTAFKHRKKRRKKAGNNNFQSSASARKLLSSTHRRKQYQGPGGEGKRGGGVERAV
jgi:hypothetical protein